MNALLNRTSLGTDGPLLIALHGGLGWDQASLQPYLDPLADRARLTYVDLLGCGASPDPEDWSAVTHATWADGVEDVRRQLGEEHGRDAHAVLFGHSYGAIVAVETALRHPDRIAGLVLCAPPSRPAHLEAAVARVEARALPDATRAAFSAALAAPPESDAALTALMPQLLPIYVHEPDRHDLASFASRVRFRAAPCRRSFYQLFPETDVRQRLGEVGVPVLVLSGRHDWVCPPDEGPAEITAGLAHAEHHVFEQSGHLPFLEEPDAFLAVVGGWLDEHVGASSLGPGRGAPPIRTTG